MPRFYRFLPLVVLCALLLVFAAASTSHAQSGGYWSRVDLGLSYANVVTFSDVFMVDDADGAWIAGGDGESGMVFRLHRVQDKWTYETYGFAQPVNSIVAIDDNNVWAVGDKGLIVHKDASGWHEMTNPVPEANLTKIQMFGSGQEGWALGNYVASRLEANDRVLLHYKDGEWEADPSVSGRGRLSDLHFVRGEGYLLADVGIGVNSVWRYSGGQWLPDPVPACPDTRHYCGLFLRGIRALGDGEAWAVGIKDYDLNPNSTEDWTEVLLHRTAAAGWSVVLPGQDILGDATVSQRVLAALFATSFTADGFGLAVGTQGFEHYVSYPHGYKPYVLSFRADGRWHYENVPFVENAELFAVSQADRDHAMAVGSQGLIYVYGYSNQPPDPWPAQLAGPMPTLTPLRAPNPPTDRVPDQHIPAVLYFDETGHSLQGGFRVYWEAHGGLQQFGYPITEELDEPYDELGKIYKVQYFERAKFEYHPENRPPYDVLLSLLGSQLTATRAGEPIFRAVPPNNAVGGVFFPETGHNMAPEFVDYWGSTGGLPVYGYPISEAFEEKSQSDGKVYLVQYFERNRLEYHPELGEQYRVSLGRLGVEVARNMGW